MHHSVVAIGRTMPGRILRRATMAVALLAVAAIAGAQSPQRTAAHPLTASDEIVAQENNFLKLMRSGNVAELRKIVPEDFVAVSQKIGHREEVLDLSSNAQNLLRSYGCSLPAFKIIEPKVTFLSPEIAMLVYQPQGDFSCIGEHARIVGLVGSMWVRRDGRWQIQMRTVYADAR
jgi:hypothetical protein